MQSICQYISCILVMKHIFCFGNVKNFLYISNTFTGHILSFDRLENPAMLFTGSAAYFKTRQLSIKL